MTIEVGADWVRTMARYNAWQNEGLVAQIRRIGEDAARRDRGAFFGSILRTCSHLLWGDRVWLSRLGGYEAPPGGISESPDLFPTVAAWTEGRTTTDETILDWAAPQTDRSLRGNLSWHSGALRRDVSRPRGLLVTHFFNHQTHHRGQIHAMLTAAGARPGDTDLFAMPGL